MLSGAYGAGADKLWALLTPHPVPPCKHPRGIAGEPADNGGIPVAGKRYGLALLCDAYNAGTDQFCLLAPYPARALIDPRGAESTVIPSFASVTQLAWAWR